MKLIPMMGAKHGCPLSKAYSIPQAQCLIFAGSLTEELFSFGATPR
jgi:hypothetical protein